jgi:hypothetical protein
MYIYPRTHLQFHCHIRVLTLIVGCVRELSEVCCHFRYVRAGAWRGLCTVGGAFDQSCIRQVLQMSAVSLLLFVWLMPRAIVFKPHVVVFLFGRSSECQRIALRPCVEPRGQRRKA